MQKDIVSKRTQKWLDRNDLKYDIVKDKVLRYCKDLYNFQQYNVSFEIKQYNGKSILKIKSTENNTKRDKIATYYAYTDNCLIGLFLVTKRIDQQIEIEKFSSDDCWKKLLSKIVADLKGSTEMVK